MKSCSQAFWTQELNVSVIAERHCPREWPKQIAISALQGIGQTNTPEQSTEPLHWTDHEGHEGDIRSYILPNLPVNLWGRDVMTHMVWGCRIV